MGFDDVELEFTPEAVSAIADKALERSTGARGLRSIIEDCMTDIMFDTPSDPDIIKVIVNKSCIEDGAPPEIIREEKLTLTEQLSIPEFEKGGADEKPADTEQ